MTSGAHEMWARASGWLWPAAADHLWQSALFAAVVFGLTLLVRRGAARGRHALWLVALLKFAAPPALFALLAAGLGLEPPLVFTQSGETEAAGAAFVLRLAEPVASFSNVVETKAVGASSAHAEVYCALSLVWLAGCATLLAVRLRRRREFVRGLAEGREVYAGREFESLERARTRLGVDTAARLLLSPRGIPLSGPCVWRVREPLVVLPETLAAHLDEEELESLLMHELAHVERRDNLVAGLQAALTCVFWFCPPVWAVGRKLVEERERACDERVLEAGGAAAPYASGILKVVRFCTGWTVAGVAGAAAGPNLRRRIEGIMAGKTEHGRTGWARALPSAAAVAALAVSAGAGVYSYAQQGGAGRGRLITQETRVGGGAQSGAERSGVNGASAAVIEQSPESHVNYDNAGGAPLVITEAKMRLVSREQLERADGLGADSPDERARSDFFLTTPSVTVANHTAKTVREVGIGFVTSGRVSVIAGYPAEIRPGESQTFRSEWERRNVILPGTLADVTVQVAWVEFTDGTQWGGRTRPPQPPDAPPPPDAPAVARAPYRPAHADAPPDDASPAAPSSTVRPAEAPTAPTAPATPDAPRAVVVGGPGGGGAATAQGGPAGVAQVNGGILNRRVRSAPDPVYPATAKAARAGGTVAVRIVIDEEGNVISAEAVSGHPLLRGASVEAARAAKFAPTRLSGKPVKVAGHLTYNFVLPEKKGEQ